MLTLLPVMPLLEGQTALSISDLKIGMAKGSALEGLKAKYRLDPLGQYGEGEAWMLFDKDSSGLVGQVAFFAGKLMSVTESLGPDRKGEALVLARTLFRVFWNKAKPPTEAEDPRGISRIINQRYALAKVRISEGHYEGMDEQVIFLDFPGDSTGVRGGSRSLRISITRSDKFGESVSVDELTSMTDAEAKRLGLTGTDSKSTQPRAPER